MRKRTIGTMYGTSPQPLGKTSTMPQYAPSSSSSSSVYPMVALPLDVLAASTICKSWKTPPYVIVRSNRTSTDDRTWM